MCRPLPLLIDDPHDNKPVTPEMKKRMLQWWTASIPNRIRADTKVHFLGPYRVKGSK
jgi:hypothetical protein